MNIRKGSIGDTLLLTLEKASEGVVSLETFSYSGQLRALRGLPVKKTNMALVMAIRRLRKKGYINAENAQNGRIILKLTSLGNEFLQERGGIEWDGKYRIAVWDIPESKRTIRNLFRRKLKNWGFVNWQRSVWVSKRNVTSPLRNQILELGLGKWVSVIESDDQVLESLFIKNSGAFKTPQ